MRRCKSKHRKCWIIANGDWLWCWECGAIRPNQYVRKRMKWAYPVGPEEENPWDKVNWDDSKTSS